MNQEEKSQQSTAPNFNQLELEVLKDWEENKIFEKSLEQTKDKEPFIFYDGPPFATGAPHHGSILGSTIKDAIGRYQTMKGRFVRRRWGWDCHGLPIENIVEQNLKISGKKQIEEIGIERFNKVCRDNVLKFVEEWGKMVRRMGRWVDFDNSYKTMDTTYMESVWWALKQIWDKGLIYQDRKVLLYCPRCETPISNFEVAMDNSYQDITEESVYVKFKLLPRQRIVNDLTDDHTYVLAWTTTPWTLPGNTSLNLGPDIRYVMIEQNGENYILAKDRLSIIEGEYEIRAEFPARSLEGLEYEPLFEGVIPNARNYAAQTANGEPRGNIDGDPSRAHKIYLADFVTTEDGTGVVHNAAMYGEDDYQLAKEKNLPRMDMLDHKGQYLDSGRIPENLRSVFFKTAEKTIVKDLKQKNLLYKSEHYTHSYPHCYRCATPLYYLALPAWFINIQKIKPQLLKQNEEINWFPAHLKYGRFAKSVQQAPDWNISRNRYWATALPFWKCGAAGCGNTICVGSVSELIDKSSNFFEVYPAAELGIRNWESGKENHNSKFIIPNSVLEKLDLHRPYIDQIKLKCGKCAGQMSRVPEVVDCWVESASMPFAELHYPFEHNVELSAADFADTDRRVASSAVEKRGNNPEDFQNRFPADFVAEYIPQTRAWFYVMHAVSVILFGRAPFKNVVTTGTVLAEDGSKMSKSKGNYPDPWLIIERYGVDALRFYLLASPVMNADDINFSEKSVQEINRKLNLLLYNVWSFYRMYEKTGSMNQESGIKETNHVLDKWIISRLGQVCEEVTKQLDGYNTVKAGRAILDFVSDLSTWYVRRSRDRIKQGGEQSQAALLVLGRVLAETAKLLAPFCPFLADFIFRDIIKEESVHLAAWPENFEADKKLLEQMSVLRELVEAGLSVRKDIAVKVRQPLLEIEYFLKDKSLFSPELEAVLAEELNVKKVSGRSDFVAKAGWVFRDCPLFKLALNIEMTAELKQEGIARELERQVQDLRKKSGLKIGELVDVYYNTADEKLEAALLSTFDRKKTFVSQIQKSLEIEVDFETQGVAEGKAVWIGLIKI